jgi:hypothetical protein
MNTNARSERVAYRRTRTRTPVTPIPQQEEDRERERRVKNRKVEKIVLSDWRKAIGVVRQTPSQV